MAAGDHTPPFLVFLLLLVTASCASGQSPPFPSSNNGYNPNFNPSTAIVIVVLISAFFFLGFFSIYLRSCAGDRLDPRTVRGGASAAANAARSRRGQRGLDPDILASFPTLVYSEVKSHKLGKSSLECAVCLSEFDDDETLRLLPNCDHAFHSDCIDAWLAAHVTCPVCRCNLTEPVPAVEPSIPPAPEPEPQVVIDVDQNDDVPEKDEELENLERFINMKRARSKFPRSHSTGHSLLMVMPGENLERFTLRLPENIRKEIVTAGALQRARSLVAFPGEGSSRRGYRGRSIQLGRSGRWGSGLLRTVSMKVSNWGRRGDGEGSLKGGSVKGEGSFKRGVFRRGESIKGEVSSKGGMFFRRGDSFKAEGQ